MRILKVKKQNKNKNYTPAFESLLTATPMMMSMAKMTAMARARTKASEEVTATKETAMASCNDMKYFCLDKVLSICGKKIKKKSLQIDKKIIQARESTNFGHKCMCTG